MKLSKKAKNQMGMIEAHKFPGPCYDPILDFKRLENQLGRVYEALKSGKWLTLPGIEDITGDPQASISAQIRHLRKKEFGSYEILKRRRGLPGSGLWEYKLNGKQNVQKNGQISFLV